MSLRDRLDQLDERYASKGPLALLREVPQLALLLVAVVFCAGTGTVLARSDGDERGGRVVRPALASPQDLVLGPQVGERVDAYYAGARAGLAQALQVSPATALVALVSLRRPLTPTQAGTLTAGLQVDRAYLRAAAARRAQTVTVPVREVARDLTRAYARVAARKAAEARALQELASSIDRRTLPLDRAAADDDVRVVSTERAAYAGGCACVVALVVAGTPVLLQELELRAPVAAVQVARGQQLPQLVVRPLVPEAASTGVVRALPPPPQAG